MCKTAAALLPCCRWALFLDQTARPSPPLQAQAGIEDGGRAWGGWPEGAPAQALAGLSAVYAEMIQPKFQLKVRGGVGWECRASQRVAACWLPPLPAA